MRPTLDLRDIAFGALKHFQYRSSFEVPVEDEKCRRELKSIFEQWGCPVSSVEEAREIRVNPPTHLKFRSLKQS